MRENETGEWDDGNETGENGNETGEREMGMRQEKEERK
jgi:hypothetical protein